jgi:hypothetical protein
LRFCATCSWTMTLSRVFGRCLSTHSIFAAGRGREGGRRGADLGIGLGEEGGEWRRVAGNWSDWGIGGGLARQGQRRKRVMRFLAERCTLICRPTLLPSAVLPKSEDPDSIHSFNTLAHKLSGS